LDGTKKSGCLIFLSKSVFFSGVVGLRKGLVLRAFLRGVAGICGENAWQIAGEFVVDCVVNVVF
jgi:hypothetical protein